MKNLSYIVISFFILLTACQKTVKKTNVHKFSNEQMEIDIADNLDLTIQLQQGHQTFHIPVQTGSFVFNDIDLHQFDFQSAKDTIEKDSIGRYWQLTISGDNKKYHISKQIKLKIYDRFSRFIVLNQTIKNQSGDTLGLDSWQVLSARISPGKDSLFWSFNGSSSEDRSDWILPVRKGFYKKNFMGMNDSDYGGGIPVSAVWRRDYGIALGHTLLHPELVSIPVRFDKDATFAQLSLKKELLEPAQLAPQQTYELPETFLAIYQGDCYKPLQTFSKYMQQKGLQFPPTEPAAFEPVWCAWGYERKFTINEILKTLPKVKELGFKWVVIDDGYQITEGNWHVNRKTFPKGDRQMKALVDKIHSYGLKAKIWWTPLAVDMLSDKLREHPDMLLRNENESPEYITWWDAFYMSPDHKQTLKETAETIDLFIDKWGFDGFKMDGQHLNAIPPDYNPNIDKDPEQAYRDLPRFFEMIYQEVRRKKPHAVIENCPCGTCMSFYNMTTINQAVSSDPESSWQIRTKGKVYKALIPNTAYYGDHVELSDDAFDFASTFGIGGVLGSKFTWPKDNPFVKESFLLTPEKEKTMKKWLDLYADKQLYKGKYLGDLYDIGFDLPETHAIVKDNKLYYAFYTRKAQDSFAGKIILKGLKPDENYWVYDYFNNKKYPDINAKDNTLKVQFKGFLLLEVSKK